MTELRELVGVVRVFLAQTRPQHAHLHLSVLVQNRTETSLATYTSAYMNPFCRHQIDETSEDRWFKEVRVVDQLAQTRADWQRRDEAGLPLSSFLVKTNEDVSRFQSISNYAMLRRTVSFRSTVTGHELLQSPQRAAGRLTSGIRDDAVVAVESQECTSPLGYFGSPRRNLASAGFLRRGSIPHPVERTVFSENAIIGDLLKTELPAESYMRADYVFSIPENEDVVELELSRPVAPTDVDAALAQLRQRVSRQGNLSIQFHGRSWNGIDTDSLNHFLPYLKKQVAVCANIHGYLQRSANSLIGFRDVFQAVEGHLLDRPQEARAKILEALSRVLEDGRCPRQYSLSVNGHPARFDLREFVDQGAWAISAVYNYLAVTGDTAILEETLAYHRLASADGSRCEPATQCDTVLDHLLRIVDYLMRQRDRETGLVRALYGDWNDALDGLGLSDDPQLAFGSGVSVMTSLQLLQNCRQMADILAHFAPSLGTDLQRLEQLGDELRTNLLTFAVARRGESRRIFHGWGDGRRYEIGGFCDCDGVARDALTVNAFWVLADMFEVDPTLRPHVLAAFHRLDSPFGFKTFSPGFGREAEGVGRISRLPLGAAENGAVYLHATAFAIAALFQMGEAKEAWLQIAKILPFGPQHLNLSHSPFVMPNSYVLNPELNLCGESMNDWQTGASNVLLKLIVRYVLGFQPRLNELRIAPANWMPFDEFDFRIVVRNCRLNVSFRSAGVIARKYVLNGIPLAECVDCDICNCATLSYSLLSDRDEHDLEIVSPHMSR